MVDLDRDGIGAGRQRVGNKGASAPTIINGSDFIRGNGPAPNCEIIHDTGQMTSSTAVVDTEIGYSPVIKQRTGIHPFMKKFTVNIDGLVFSILDEHKVMPLKKVNAASLEDAGVSSAAPGRVEVNVIVAPWDMGMEIAAAPASSI